MAGGHGRRDALRVEHISGFGDIGARRGIPHTVDGDTANGQNDDGESKSALGHAVSPERQEFAKRGSSIAYRPILSKVPKIRLFWALDKLLLRVYNIGECSFGGYYPLKAKTKLKGGTNV